MAGPVKLRWDTGSQTLILAALLNCAYALLVVIDLELTWAALHQGRWIEINPFADTRSWHSLARDQIAFGAIYGALSLFAIDRLIRERMGGAPFGPSICYRIVEILLIILFVRYVIVINNYFSGKYGADFGDIFALLFDQKRIYPADIPWLYAMIGVVMALMMMLFYPVITAIIESTLHMMLRNSPTHSPAHNHAHNPAHNNKVNP